MVAAHELGLADRITTIRTVVAMVKPNLDLMPQNPLSKLPTLVLDDGTVLFDSLTICEYLDHLAGGGQLFPPPGPARWRTLTRHALANGLLDALILWRNERDKPEARQTPAWLTSFAIKVEACLDNIDADVPALTASRIGIEHVATACTLAYLDFRFPDLDWRTSRPALAGWFAGFAARPSMQATAVVDDA